MKGMGFVELLKDCAKKKDLCKGAKLHADILERGLLQRCPQVGNTLVSMYAKCGALVKARQVLNELPMRNVVSWNALIAGYTEHGQSSEALNCLESMQNDGLFPNAITYISILKACSNIRAINKAKMIHDEIASTGLLCKDLLLGSSLVDLYAKCGLVTKALEVLEELPVRNVVSWSALIAGYVQEGQYNEAFNCFHRMQNEGLSPDAVTFACILKACGSMGALDKGRQIHDEIMDRGLLCDDIVLGNALVDMYAKCGSLAKAQEVLDGLHVRDIVSWNTLIGRYADHAYCDKAMSCFRRLQSEGFYPNNITFINLIKACTRILAVDKGKRIHVEIIGRGLLHKDIVLGNTLVDMYAKCGHIKKAERMLHELSESDVVSWNSLIAGYIQQGENDGALNCFEEMQRKGVSPDSVTLLYVVKAYGDKREVENGKRIHDEIVTRGLLHESVTLGTALVEMYAKCGLLTKAEEVFFDLPVQDVVSWSALIAGYVLHGQSNEAMSHYERMRSEGFPPDAITFASILQACGSMRAIGKGKQIHDEIVNRGLLHHDTVLGNALVDMYSKCGFLAKAQEVFDSLPFRNVVTWNALIAGYVQDECNEEAFSCFELMQSEGISPDSVTFICILKACAESGAIQKGRQIHEEIANKGFLNENISLVTALVDLYAKCGVLEKAREVHESLSHRDVVSWNALIAGYAWWGKGVEALECFEKMQKEGTYPDAATFLSLLNACSWLGRLDEAQVFFEDMTANYGIMPNLEHYTCMVDIFGRAGYLDKAVSAIMKMPSSDCPAAWRALLTACRKWENVQLGKLAFDEVVKLDNNDAAAYVLMADLYAAVNMKEDAKKVESMNPARMVCNL